MNVAARAATFTAFLVANLGLIFANRSRAPAPAGAPGGRERAPRNRALWAVTLAALGFITLVLFVPPLSRMFRFGAVGARSLALSVGAGIASVAWIGLVRRRGLWSPTGGVG